MVRSVCCVPGCPNISLDNPDLSYHHLPLPDERRRKWLENMGRLDIVEKSWKEVKGLKICGAHFAPDQYRSPLTKRLNIGAIPTIFVHEPEIPSPPTVSGVKKKESQEIPTIELPGTSQAVNLKQIISTKLSNILQTSFGESPNLEVSSAVMETSELGEFSEFVTIEQCIFGDAVIDSNEDETNINGLEMDETSRLSTQDSRLSDSCSLPVNSGSKSLVTEFTSEMFSVSDKLDSSNLLDIKDEPLDYPRYSMNQYLKPEPDP